MLNYREANLADLAAICRLGEEVNSIHHEAFPQIFAEAGEEKRDAEHWLRNIEEPDASIIVGEESGELVGFVSVSIAVETSTLLQPICFGRVGSVGVTAKRRGEGIGRNLMARAQQWVYERGAAEVRLSVWAFNTEALKLYHELGYETRSFFLAKQLPGVA